MKAFSAETKAALRSGKVIVSGAVRIGLDAPLRVWGGYGDLDLGGETHEGIGDRGLAQVSAGSLGGQEQGASLVLSGVDPDIVPDLDLAALRGRSVVLRRLIFNGTGSALLDASVFLRGRVDRAPIEDAETSTVTVAVEGAARGLGRRSERMRTDSDQRMIDETDAGFRRIGYAAEKAIYFGGKPPIRAGAAFGGSGSGVGPGASGGGASGGGRDITDVNTDTLGRW